VVLCNLKIHKTKRLVVNLSCVIKPVKPKREWGGFNFTGFVEDV